MKRKQKKSLPWRRFGYVILIIIKFSELLLWFSPRIINALRSYIKHEEECFIRYPNTSKLVKKTRLRLVFSTHFSSVFGYLMKHSSSCLIYYITDHRFGSIRLPLTDQFKFFFMLCKRHEVYHGCKQLPDTTPNSSKLSSYAPRSLYDTWRRLYNGAWI